MKKCAKCGITKEECREKQIYDCHGMNAGGDTTSKHQWADENRSGIIGVKEWTDVGWGKPDEKDHAGKADETVGEDRPWWERSFRDKFKERVENDSSAGYTFTWYDIRDFIESTVSESLRMAGNRVLKMKRNKIHHGCSVGPYNCNACQSIETEGITLHKAAESIIRGLN